MTLYVDPESDESYEAATSGESLVWSAGLRLQMVTAGKGRGDVMLSDVTVRKG